MLGALAFRPSSETDERLGSPGLRSPTMKNSIGFEKVLNIAPGSPSLPMSPQFQNYSLPAPSKNRTFNSNDESSCDEDDDEVSPLEAPKNIPAMSTSATNGTVGKRRTSITGKESECATDEEIFSPTYIPTTTVDASDESVPESIGMSVTGLGSNVLSN